MAAGVLLYRKHKILSMRYAILVRMGEAGLQSRIADVASRSRTFAGTGAHYRVASARRWQPFARDDLRKGTHFCPQAYCSARQYLRKCVLDSRRPEMSMTPTLKLEAVYLMDYESLEGMAASRTFRSRLGGDP